jgi:hypothetical protein
MKKFAKFAMTSAVAAVLVAAGVSPGGAAQQATQQDATAPAAHPAHPAHKHAAQQATQQDATLPAVHPAHPAHKHAAQRAIQQDATALAAHPAHKHAAQRAIQQDATAAAAPAAAPHPAHKHAPRIDVFNGLWSVSIYTQNGPCDASYRYPARIWQGQVLQAEDDFSYQLAGAVSRSGMIVVTVSKGGQSATGRGRLNATTGTGEWSTTGGECSGIWNAVRRRVTS